MVLKGVFAVLVPTRFLALLAHFFVLVCLLWDKVSNKNFISANPFFNIYITQEENLRTCSLKYSLEYANYFHNE